MNATKKPTIPDTYKRCKCCGEMVGLRYMIYREPNKFYFVHVECYDKHVTSRSK